MLYACYIMKPRPLVPVSSPILSVVIPAHNTGFSPDKTSFFQALSVPTKISKGTNKIINDVHILKPGDKVGASDATLLNVLNISPFSYDFIVKQVYDSGTIFAPAIPDTKPEDLREKFMAGIAKLAALSLAIGYPTVASAPHSIANGFKKLLPIAAVSEVEFKEAEAIKEFIKDSSKFVAAATTAAPAAAAPAAATTEEKKEEKEDSESDDDMGFFLIQLPDFYYTSTMNIFIVPNELYKIRNYVFTQGVVRIKACRVVLGRWTT